MRQMSLRKIHKNYKSLGHDRFAEWIKTKESKRLSNNDHLLLHHALKCLCERCGKLLDWSNVEDAYLITSECCGLLFRLIPWTVRVEIEDQSERPILPKSDESNFPKLTESIENTEFSLPIRTIIINKTK